MKYFWAVASIGFFGFICLVIYGANTGSDSPIFDLVRAVPFGDKLGHLVLFGLLAFLANKALGGRFFGSPWLQVGSVVVLAFAIGEELTQGFNANRTMDIRDVLADLIGVGIATVLRPRRPSDGAGVT